MILVGCSSQRRFGYYKDSSYTFRIGPDGDFHYDFDWHMIGDSSSGTYKICGVTIKFTYRTLPVDSVRILLRYQSGFWKGKRIYPLDGSGQLVSGKNYLKFQKQ